MPNDGLAFVDNNRLSGAVRQGRVETGKARLLTECASLVDLLPFHSLKHSRTDLKPRSSL